MLTFVTKSVEETRQIAKKLSREIYSGACVCVIGEMGVGKTQFVSGFLEARSVRNEDISSPTFTFVKKHKLQSEEIAHYDLYRFDKKEEEIGLHDDVLDDEVTVLIEWAEKLKDLPIPRVEVRIEKSYEKNTGQAGIECTRTIRIEFIGYSFSPREFIEFQTSCKIPTWVQEHINQVTKLALELTDNLVEAGFILDRELIRQSCLLHDAFRYVDFHGGFIRAKLEQDVDDETWEYWNLILNKYKGKHHAIVAAEVLSKLGYKWMARLIIAHKTDTVFQGFKNVAEKIICYADKRVKHDKIVTIEERISDLSVRYRFYHQDDKYWTDLLNKLLELEKELLIN